MIFACLFFLTITTSLSPTTVIITHGLGTSGIDFYQDSAYIQKIAESAEQLSYATKSVAWLSEHDSNKNYAGFLPQERIEGAVTIAKEIIDELALGNSVILIGHSYGGQVMQCATRLLNDANKDFTDSCAGDLIYTIKHLLDKQKTKGFNINCLVNTIIAGWHISEIVFNIIEKTEVVNKNLTTFVKQYLSLQFIDEMKKAWNHAFKEIQDYKKRKKIAGTKHLVAMLYTIGTPHNGDKIFSADMDVVKNHINFYSTEDTKISFFSNLKATHTNNTTNISVYFEPQKSFAPEHQSFCGNVIMAPWILMIPDVLKTKKASGFNNFSWGHDGMVTFFVNKEPCYKQL